MLIENNNRCLVCGQDNQYGLQVKPDIDSDSADVKIECTPPEHFQGWANIVHGGILGTLLDEAISYVGIASFNSPAMTVQLEIRFKNPAPVGKKLIITAKRAKIHQRLIEATSDITLEDGTLIASAKGKVMKVGKNQLV